MVDRRVTRPDAATPSNGAGAGAAEKIAMILSALWLGAMALLFLVFAPEGEGSGPLQTVMILIAVVLPVAMIWVAAKVITAARMMREESARMKVTVDAIRQSALQTVQGMGAGPNVTQKLDELAAAQRKTESALTTFTSTRAPLPVPDPAPVVGDDDQVALPLGTSAEEIRPPLEHEDFIRALNFPETAEDRDGFAALRRAMRDRTTAKLVQAAQDILTLMSQEGIYMDDLRPDLARPELWRRFAAGERGRQVAALGGVHDRTSLALTTARMKQDPIFRDAAHHFLRKYDHMFAEFAPEASDAEISALSNTRTARAFMLLGRVAGTFD